MFDAVNAGEDIASRELGTWILEQLADLSRGEAAWLEALGRFDAEGTWAIDGQLSAIEWLTQHAQLSRATAYEKVRVARALRRRPVLAEAFRSGRVGYSAVRVLTRLEDPDPEVDEALVVLAEAGTVADLEKCTQRYQRYVDQEKPLPDPALSRKVILFTNPDGTGELHITLTALELEEARVGLQAFIDQEREVSPRGDTAAAFRPSPGSPSEQSPCGDSDSASGLRADAFMALLRTAVAHAHKGRPPAGDRYLVHIVTTDGAPPTLADGTLVDEDETAVVGCGGAKVAHTHASDGEPLAVGRLHRDWNTSQRRAARIRDGGHCRFPGCERRIADLHHQLPWDDGGPTDIDNGFLLCRRHHRLLHKGFAAEGNPNQSLVFTRPDGTLIGTTEPAIIRHRRHQRIVDKARRRPAPAGA